MILSVVLALISGFVVAWLTTPLIIRKCREVGLVDIDLHKPQRPEVAKLGGLAIMIGFLSSITVTGFFGLDPLNGIAVLLSGALGGMLGLMDDLFKLDKRVLVVGSALAGMPMVAFRAGSTVIYATPWGPVDLGWVFWILVPLGFAYLMNAVNIYAGFNGLEAGLGLVTSGSLAICAAIYNSWISAVALAGLSGALLAFLRWNAYPAETFPGNVGTYLVGAVVAASVVAGTIKAAGFIASLPYFVNFLIRLRRGFKWTVGSLSEDGLLRSDGLEALWSIWMMKDGCSEKEVFVKSLVVQVVCGCASILYSLITSK